MLTPASLFKLVVSRFLPSPTPDGPENEGYLRGLRYRELAVGSMVRKSHLLADEGSYFVVNNAQTGILEGTNTGFLITGPTMYLANNADPSNPLAKSIYPDYIDLSVSVSGTTATAVTSKSVSVYLVKGNNYASAGTELTSKIVSTNPSSLTGSIARCYFGALVTTDPAVSKGTTRVIVGQRVYRMPVNATTQPDTVGDRLRIEFGSVEAESSVAFGTSGAVEANVFQTVLKLPPVVVPPGWSLHVCTWDTCTTYSTAVTWLPEAGWWER